jgi:hypothetical protein
MHRLQSLATHRHSSHTGHIRHGWRKHIRRAQLRATTCGVAWCVCGVPPDTPRPRCLRPGAGRHDDGRVTALADAVLPLVRTRADVWRWNVANAHGERMHARRVPGRGGQPDIAVRFGLTSGPSTNRANGTNEKHPRWQQLIQWVLIKSFWSVTPARSMYLILTDNCRHICRQSICIFNIALPSRAGQTNGATRYDFASIVGVGVSHR